MATEGTPAGNGANRTLTAAGEDRRAAIVAAAEHLFAQQGYAKTRMSDIAAATGVTKGLLYWYFESKQDLIAEILLRTRQELREAQAEALDGVGDPLERLYVGTYTSAQFILAHYRLYLFGGEIRRDLTKVLRESSQVHADDTAATIAQGQAKGVVRGDEDATALAFANAGVVNSLCGAAFYGSVDSDPDVVGHTTARYVVRMCAATPGLATKVSKKFADGILR